jgi:tetratricopeptide (TPR) repeat protein
MATEGTGAGAAKHLGRGWKVSPSVRISPHQTFTVAEIQGPGAIQQIWMTTFPGFWRSAILRMYWDGEATPSVETPLGRLLRGGGDLQSWQFLWSSDRESLQRARELAERAVALDNTLAEAYRLLGQISLWQKEHDRAIAQAQRAVAVTPNDADGYETLAEILAWSGQPDESLRIIRLGMRKSVARGDFIDIGWHAEDARAFALPPPGP